MKQSFMMRLTSRRFFGKLRLDEVACVSVGPWDAARASLGKRGFLEKDDGILMRKNASLARVLSCDYVLADRAEDVEAGILRQRERCRALNQWRPDAGGRANFLVLLYKSRVSEADIRALRRGQTDAMAFQRSLGPQKLGGTMLLVLADESAETGFFCRAADAAAPAYDRCCRMLADLFGEIC